MVFALNPLLLAWLPAMLLAVVVALLLTRLRTSPGKPVNAA